MNRAVSQVVVAAVCALLGFLLTYQFKELNSANSGNIDYNSSDILSEIENLKKEMNNFFKDLDENIKDKEELLYVKQRTSDLVDFMAGEIEKIMDYKEDKLNALIKKQEQADRLIQELNDKMDNVYEDIYDEVQEENFTISCPYCNYEFDAEIDEDFNEIRCPECGNLIELDWNGNPNDDQDKGNGCSGGCSHCDGCK